MKVSRVITICAEREKQGVSLSEQFSVPHIDVAELAGAKNRHIETFIRAQVEIENEESAFVFVLNESGLSLAQVTKNSFLSIQADFYGPTVSYRRHKGGGKGQMIAKAVGLGSEPVLKVLDATAGLGSDAFVLASLGCQVTMIERVPEVRALLKDAIAQAIQWGETKDPALVEIVGRMQLIESDASTYMQTLDTATRPDVVYLDPMFPMRNKSAQVKKEMRVFHDLVGGDPDSDTLLEPALKCARKRVVVKRPRHAATLSSHSPSHKLDGKSNRYDIYVCH